MSFIAPTCKVCFEKYDEDKRLPKMLSCGHTFCDECTRQGTTAHICPVCRCNNFNKSCPTNYELLQYVKSCVKNTPRNPDTSILTGLYDIKMRYCKELKYLTRVFERQNSLLEIARIQTEQTRENIERLSDMLSRLELLDTNAEDNSNVITVLLEAKEKLKAVASLNEILQTKHDHLSSLTLTVNYNGQILAGNLSSFDKNGIQLHAMSEPSWFHENIVIDYWDNEPRFLNESSIVFMDFKSVRNNSTSVKLHIKINTNIDYGQILHMMCSGVRGCSHKNSGNIVQHVQYITLGSASSDINETFQDIVYSTNPEMHQEDEIPNGSVFIDVNEDISTRFNINFHAINNTGYKIIGKVISGMNLWESFRHEKDTKSLQISDCGVVLSY